jgi:hypothetical protein
VRRVDARHAERPGGDAHAVALDQRPRRLGQVAEAVDQLLLQRVEPFERRGVGEPLVERKPLVHVAAVGGGQDRRHVQVDLGVEVEVLLQLRRPAGLQGAHRALEHPGIEREADLLHLARLLFAQDLAGAADLEVVHREIEARAEVLHHRDRFEALGGVAAQRFLGRREEIGVGLVVRAADAAAQLVQLRQAELVGAVDDDGVGGRDVDPGLDDGRAEQHVVALRCELPHHALQVALAHLAVRHRDARFGQEPHQPFAHALDRVDLVMEEVDLPAALQLAHHCLADQAFGPGVDEGLDGEPLLGRGGDHREVADSLQGHRQRARDRRRGQGEHVDLGAQALQRFLLPHAEAVLFVDDHQPELLEGNVLRQELVGADDDVDFTGFCFSNDLRGLFPAPEPGKLGDFHRPVGEAILECLKVLLGEEGGRAEHRYLLAVGDSDERRAQRHFGLAEADVAAD